MGAAGADPDRDGRTAGDGWAAHPASNMKTALSHILDTDHHHRFLSIHGLFWLHPERSCI